MCKKLPEKLRMPFAFLGGAFVFLVFASLVGCTTLGNLITPPQVALESVALRDITPTDSTAVFNLQITNPNPFSIHITGLTYDLNLNDREVFSGVLDQRVDLVANGISTLGVPVKVDYVKTFDSVSQMLQRETSGYVLKGSVVTSVATVPFEQKGTLALPGLRSIGR